MTFPYVKDQLNNLRTDKSAQSSDFDVVCMLGFIMAFGLPLTLLYPNFSIWTVVPKMSITRLHFFEQELSWLQLHATVMTLFVMFFCLYLEVKKRALDELLNNVIGVSEATETTVQVEKVRQQAAMKVCMELLNTSSNHYEQMMLLRDDIRKRELAKQGPPTIDFSSFEL